MPNESVFQCGLQLFEVQPTKHRPARGQAMLKKQNNKKKKSYLFHMRFDKLAICFILCET